VSHIPGHYMRYNIIMVDHATPARRLLSLQVPGFIIHWIISFLTYRTQATKPRLRLFTLLFINRLIVQGSSIRPTLFIMSAHDLKPLDISNYLLKYVSQGSVVKYARCGGIFNMHLTAKLQKNLPVIF